MVRKRHDLNQEFETIDSDLAFIFKRSPLLYLLANVCSIFTALTRVMKFHLRIHEFSFLPSSGGRKSGLLETKKDHQISCGEMGRGYWNEMIIKNSERSSEYLILSGFDFDIVSPGH
jgi:hypothetical protein